MRVVRWTGRAFAVTAWLALTVGPAWGAPRLAWDPNPPEEGVTGYTVYWGRVSRHDPVFAGYEASADTDATEYALPLPADRNTLYFAALVARNAHGLASDYSVEVTIAPEALSARASADAGGCFVRSLYTP